MSLYSSYIHPSLRDLLASEVLSEAQVLSGENLVDRAVINVCCELEPQLRANSLLVCRQDFNLESYEGEIERLCAVVLISPFQDNKDASKAQPESTAVSKLANATEPQSKGLSVKPNFEQSIKLCQEAEVPLIVLPGYDDEAVAAEEIRLALQLELKRCSARLHSSLVAAVLEQGLGGLATCLADILSRPVAIESSDFKLLASQELGATPQAQQRILSEEIAERINRQERARNHDYVSSGHEPVKVGRRLVLPVVLKGVVVAYVSTAIKPGDDTTYITECLKPAALACIVHFSERRQDNLLPAVTHQSLLKDLLSGRGLSAADQERLERHYGFDLCDGLLVFALQVVSGKLDREATNLWPERPYVYTEVEGTQVFVAPVIRKAELTIPEMTEQLVGLLKTASEGLQFQVGVARIASTMLDLNDAYLEARQALIIGSMMHNDQEFTLGYGDLGVKRLLYLVIDHPELERFHQENLAPLEAYDLEWESELIPTLRVYLKEGANLNSASRALFVHRHTLRYRLEQIAEILNVDIDSQEVLLNLQIAFLIKDMKGLS